MSQRLVDQLQADADVSHHCRLLGISRSGYYAWRQRASRPPCATTPILKAAFAASGQTYGSRRLVADLRQRGVVAGRFLVRRLMHDSDLKPVWRRRFVTTTDSRHDRPVADNHLARQFDPLEPNRVWSSDITYIPTRRGWLYLAIVMDLYARKIVGWAMASQMPADLVCSALRMALAQRAPEPGLLIHSDRGSQYASAEYQRLIGQHGLLGSMSGKGNCWDNAVVERFFLSLKTERVWQRDYANHAEAQRDITDYIVRFYNDRRIHSTLDNLSPNAFEQRAAA